MAPARRAVYAEHGGFSGNRVLIDRLEYRATKGRDGYAWEGDAWFGGDHVRLWLKSEGEGSFGGALHHGEVQALFSRAVSPWFNLQGGVRKDFGSGPNRTHLALGVQGLAPYWFELDAAAFLSTRGEVTARIEAEYDQRLTNQLILQPRVELGLALQDMPDLRTGAGFTQIEAGLRLRYEIVPEFAPYVGIDWERSLGRTARFARNAGEETGGVALVAGIRAWF
jgi:copper resistance protein B